MLSTSSFSFWREKKTFFSHNTVKLILCENLLHGAQIAELLVQVILAPPTSAK